jgi:hypothetical protein
VQDGMESILTITSKIISKKNEMGDVVQQEKIYNTTTV